MDIKLVIADKDISEEALIKNIMRIVRRVNIYNGEKIKLDLYELLADDNTPKSIYWSENMGTDGSCTGTLYSQSSTWSLSRPTEVIVT